MHQILELNRVSDNEEESDGTLTLSGVIGVSAQLALKIKPTSNTNGNENSKQNHPSFIRNTLAVGATLPVKSAIDIRRNTAKQKCTSQMRPSMIRPKVLNKC